MNIFGKIIASILGAKIFGFPGFLLGLWLGHLFDKGMSNVSKDFKFHNPHETQGVFFDCTFAVMGHIVKSDGQVSQNEINIAEQIMAKLGIAGEKRSQAIEAFKRGKSAEFDLFSSLNELATQCKSQTNLVQMFLEIQIIAATADGQIKQSGLNILYQIGAVFKISQQKMNHLIEMVMAQASFYEGNSQQSGSSKPSIDQAYKVLGVDSSSQTAEIKRAYRKLMSQHHPDRLVSKGMPEEMIKVATEKCQEIQNAYEMIKKQHNF